MSELRAKVSGINHVTLAVSDLDRSISFYRDLLGCGLRARWEEGAYLEAGAMWLCLSRDLSTRQAPHPDYTHLAFDVAESDFAALSEQVAAAARIWKTDHSEGSSLYFLDPDGHKLELHVGTLASRLASYRATEPRRTMKSKSSNLAPRALSRTSTIALSRRASS